MLRWLSAALQRAKSLFRSKRDIFKFWDGRKWRYADPIVLDRKLNAACPEWQDVITFLRIPEVASPVPMPEHVLADARVKQAGAIMKLADVVCAVFDVAPLDVIGNGMTEAARLLLLAKFLNFCNAIREEAVPLQTSSEQPATSARSTTAPSVASTSTESVSASSTPATSLTA